MTIYYEDEAGIPFEFDPENKLKEVISFVAEYVKCPSQVEVSVMLVDKKSIHQMNLEFRDVDKATDVLSFPMIEYDAPAAFDGTACKDSLSISQESGEWILGDIVLCSEVVKEQAAEYGHSEEREFCFLVVHSMLHLFGYDHIQQDDRVEMEEKQREIMNMLGICR